MQLRYIIWHKRRDGLVAPIMADSPAGITSSEWAREEARTLVLEHKIKARTLQVTNLDGNVLEEWRWRNGKWRATSPQRS